MNDISNIIEGFYTLLKAKGIEKRELRIKEDILDRYGVHSADDLKDYVARHVVDVIPGLKRITKDSVEVPLDRSRFYGGDHPRFSMDRRIGRVIGCSIGVSLIDENGKWHPLSYENFVDPKMRALALSADICGFIENYEARMKDFQELVGVLTGKVEGKLGLGYGGWRVEEAIEEKYRNIKKFPDFI